MTSAIHVLFHLQRILGIAGRVEQIVLIERVGQLLACEMGQQLLAKRLWNFGVNERSPERLAVMQPAQDRLASVAQLGLMKLDQLNGRQDFAMAQGLEKTDILGIGVDHIHIVQVDPFLGELSSQLPGDDQVAG